MEHRVEVDQRDLTRLVRALNNEADGRELRKDLVSNLRAVAEPAAVEARSSILSMSSSSSIAPKLRPAIAAQIKVSVRTSGQLAGVSIVAGKNGMPRGFSNAPKLTNRKGWRRRVFGTDRWVTQVGKPGWFDDTVRKHDPAAERGAKEALDNVAQRIQQRTHN